MSALHLASPGLHTGPSVLQALRAQLFNGAVELVSRGGGHLAGVPLAGSSLRGSSFSQVLHHLYHVSRVFSGSGQRPNHLVYLPHTYQANIPLVLNHAPPGTKELDTVPIAQSVLRLFNLASLYWFPLPAFPTENVIKALSHALPFTPVSAT